MVIDFELDVFIDTEEGEAKTPISVCANVLEERDPYATGDSPTMYEVDIVSCRNAQNVHITMNDGLENLICEEAIRLYTS